MLQWKFMVPRRRIPDILLRFKLGRLSGISWQQLDGLPWNTMQALDVCFVFPLKENFPIKKKCESKIFLQLESSFVFWCSSNETMCFPISAIKAAEIIESLQTIFSVTHISKSILVEPVEQVGLVFRRRGRSYTLCFKTRRNEKRGDSMMLIEHLNT